MNSLWQTPRLPSVPTVVTCVCCCEMYGHAVGMRAADGYGMQPSSARASVTSSEGYGPSSSRASKAQHEDSFGGGKNLDVTTLVYQGGGGGRAGVSRSLNARHCRIQAWELVVVSPLLQMQRVAWNQVSAMSATQHVLCLCNIHKPQSQVAVTIPLQAGSSKTCYTFDWLEISILPKRCL